MEITSFEIPLDMEIAANAGQQTAYGFGMKSSNETEMRSVYLFQDVFSDDSITRLNTTGIPPSPRGKPVMAVSNKKLIIYGGYDLQDKQRKVDDNK